MFVLSAKIVPDLLKAKVKGHYRHLPNGRTVWIEQHTDKRKDAKKDPKKFRHRVVHSDDKSTTYSNAKGEQKTYPHQPHQELSQDDIHATLNSPFHIDEKLALDMFKRRNGIEDMEPFLDELIADEKEKAKNIGEEPEFKDREGAMKYVMRNQVRGILKELQKGRGSITTYAQASQDIVLADHLEHTIDDPAASDHDRAMAHMAVEHGESAIKALEEEMANVKKAQKLGPKDAPKIDGIAPDVTAFGHQAETLAKLNVLQRAIIDVDMGGGKGFILPADALNLMSQGKVKKPLIVVPGATLEQNAAKIIEYTKGGANVFLIDNNTIKDMYDGDEEKMLEDIRNAPANTLFMASYGVFSYKEKDSKDEDGDGLERARKVGSAGWDYVAADESHNFKNTDSLRFKGMQYLSKAKYKRVASGTFLSNNPSDVLGQMLFLYPQMGMSKADFEDKYGRRETSKGVKWDAAKLKNLREDLTDLGMISLRRSAWIHALPERNENLSVVEMDADHRRIHDAVLDDVLDSLEAEMKANPKLKKLFEGDEDLDNMNEELPPSATGALELIGSITDFPDEIARVIEQRTEAVKAGRKGSRHRNVHEQMTKLQSRKSMTDKQKKEHQALSKEWNSFSEDERRFAQMNLDDEDEESPLYAEYNTLKTQLKRLKPATRRAVQALRGKVSPKALDVYQKAAEHLKSKKNGKMIVFVQRKLSAQHIVNNMPAELKKHAMYFDASLMGDLPNFTQDPNGPKILVAVDASVKEGMNMQIANGMYRYDHHYSPGNQEQSYARIWRFGQDKPANIHLGVVNGGIDVPKYARLISKLHTNQMVVSDMQDDDTFEAYKLSLDNIRNNRESHILGDYLTMNKKIIDFQKEENKPLRKKYGEGAWKVSSGKKIGGAKAKQMHGMGPYMHDFDVSKMKVPHDDDMEKIVGHYRDTLRGGGKGHLVYDAEFQDAWLPEVVKLVARHNARGGGKKMDPFTMEQYHKEFEETNGRKLSDREEQLLTKTVNNYLSGKKHSPHKSGDPSDAIQIMRENFKIKGNKSTDKVAAEDVKALVKHLGDTHLMHMAGGKVDNPEVAEKYWKQLEKKEGAKIPDRYKRVVMGAASIVQEVGKGWEGIKDYYSDVFMEGDQDEEDE